MTRQDQWIFLDRYRRKLLVKYELKRRLLKSLKHNQKLTLTQSLLVSLHTSLLPTASSLTKRNNRCFTSGRNKNVLSKTKSSRFVFRQLSNNASLPGVRRYSR